MPKGNPGRLKSRFEIRGELTPNEFEFQQHHGEMTEQEHENFPPSEEQEEKAARKVSAKSGAKKGGKKSAGKSAKSSAGKKSAKRR